MTAIQRVGWGRYCAKTLPSLRGKMKVETILKAHHKVLVSITSSEIYIYHISSIAEQIIRDVQEDY